MRRVRLSLAVAALAAFFVVAVTAGGADTFTVRLVSQTSSTITLGWDPQPGYGYLFFADGELVSRTNDQRRATVKFSKQYSAYEVAVDAKGASGVYPPPAPPVDSQPPSAPGAVRSAGATVSTVSVAWDAAVDNVGVTNYRVFRGTTLIGQGPGSSGGFANVWEDGNLSCGTAYVYGVDAQDAAGNTSPRTTATLSTAACAPSAACADGLDNDADGKTDLADPGCSSSTDTDETDPPQPAGTDVWVATSGNNTTCQRGVQSLPCATVQRALQLTQAGDEVEVAAGTYAGAQTWAGTNAVTVVAAPGSTPVISGLVTWGASNVTVRGLRFTGTGGALLDGSGLPNGSSVVMTGDNNTIDGSQVAQVLRMDGANGFRVTGSRLLAMHISMSDGWVVQGNTVDAERRAGGNIVCGSQNWQVLDNTFRNAFNDANPSQHTEIWYVGGGNNGGLFQGNTFGISATSVDSSSTAHIFFTWFNHGNCPSSDPVNICVKGNTFYPAWNPYWFVKAHEDLGVPQTISVAPAPGNTFVFSGGKPSVDVAPAGIKRNC